MEWTRCSIIWQQYYRVNHQFFSKIFSVDEELAKKLQEQYLVEKIVAERTDRDFVNSRIRQQDTQSHTADEGSRGSVGQATGSRMRNFIKNRQKQEDEDATFARAIQEEEEARAQYPDQNPSWTWQSHQGKA